MRKFWRALPVALLVLLAPLEVYSVVLPGAVHLTLYFALVVALMPLFVIRIRAEYPLPVYLFMIFFFWSVCGVLLAGGQWDGYRGLGVQVMEILTLAYVVTFVRDSDTLEIAFTSQIAAGVIAAAMGMTEFVAFVFFKTIIRPPFADLSGMEGGGYNFMGELMRMHGFFTASNHLGAYLLLPFGLSLYRSYYARAHRRLYGLITLLLLITIFTGLARSAYLGVLIIFAMVGARWARTFARSTLLIALATAAIGFLYATPNTGFEPLDRANPFHDEARVTVEDYTSKDIWSEHFQAAVVGSVRTVGLGQGVQSFDEWAYQRGLVSVWGSHSDFIMFLGENGIVGFACQVLIVLYVCRLCWRGYRSDRRKGRPPFFYYLMATFLAVVSTGVTRTYYYWPTSFIFIGMIIQAYKLSALPDSEGAKAARSRTPSPLHSSPHLRVAS